MRRGAIRQALSLANKSGQVQLAELSLKDIKTKDAVSALEKLKATGRILIVVPEYNEVVSKSVSNIPGVRVSSATHINVFDIMNADSIIIDPKALSLISEWLGA